jgi:transcription elongation factor GreA
MAQTHHLSQAAFDRLKAEHDDLTTRGRVEIARKIETARELGDLSENGDYHAAKEEQGKMEGRIRHIEALLAKAEIVEGDAGGEVGGGGGEDVAACEGRARRRDLVLGVRQRHGAVGATELAEVVQAPAEDHSPGCHSAGVLGACAYPAEHGCSGDARRHQPGTSERADPELPGDIVAPAVDHVP